MLVNKGLAYLPICIVLADLLDEIGPKGEEGAELKRLLKKQTPLGV